MRCLAGLLVFLLAAEPAFAVCPTMDGAAIGGGVVGANSIATAGLTTALTNDVIVVHVTAENTDGLSTTNPPAASTVVGSTLGSFARRGMPKQMGPSLGCRDIFGPNCWTDDEVWWAPAAAAITGEIITVTFSANVVVGMVQAVAVNGASLVTPWDTNGSLPKVGSVANSSSSPSVSGVSTTNSPDILFAFCSTYTVPSLANSCQQGVPSPFSAVANQQAIQAFIGISATSGIMALAESVPQSGITVAPANTGPVETWVLIADAIYGSACGGPPPPTPSRPRLPFAKGWPW